MTHFPGSREGFLAKSRQLSSPRHSPFWTSRSRSLDCVTNVHPILGFSTEAKRKVTYSDKNKIFSLDRGCLRHHCCSNMTSGVFPSRPAYGKRLLVALIAEIAKEDPHRLYCLVPLSRNVEEGFREVTMATFANAINVMAQWIERECGHGSDGQTLGYMGSPDLRYHILVIAAQKAGYAVSLDTARGKFYAEYWKPYLPSPRNSVEAHIKLLEATDCEVFLTSSPSMPHIDEILAARKMKQAKLPELSYFLDSPQVPEYPFSKSFDEARDDPFVIMHTSGSTGFPKKIVITQAAWAAQDNFRLVKDFGYSESTLVDQLPGKLVFLALPPFHSGGLSMGVVFQVYYNYACIWPPPGPMTADVANSVIMHGKPQFAMLAPSVIEDIVKTPNYLENLEHLDLLIFGGGPLTKETGDIVARKCAILGAIGSTETSILPVHMLGNEYWQYFRFLPCLGLDFRHHWGNLYEMVVVRQPELEQFQSVFTIFPDLQEYSTKDLYSPHPRKADVWSYEGRADDVIVFSTGEKINPVTMEGFIGHDKEVDGVIAVGQGRFQAALLIEPKKFPDSDIEFQQLLDRIWPTVQEANKGYPAHGQIFRDFIILTSPGKPMARTSKGTVQRLRTLRDYQQEIDALFAKAGDTADGDVKLDTTSHQSILKSLHTMVRPLLGVEELSDSADLFSLGLDSLKVSTLVRRMNNSIRETDRPAIPSTTIYANPTLEGLSWCLGNEQGDMRVQGGDRELELDKVVDQYCQDLPLPARKPKAPNRKSVLLTGSTGSVGSWLLDALLSDPSIQKIHCLNRPHAVPSEKRQRQIMSSNHFVADLDPARVAFHEADLSKSTFGLSQSVFEDLLDSVTEVIHNAWEVNFNLSLQSFIHPHVEGVRRLIDFSSLSKFGASITFLSTIGTVLDWRNSHDGPMPEMPLEDWGPVQHSGYAESKAVCERLLESAARVSGVVSNICRVGQVAGPTSGQSVWNPKEWFPSIIVTSASLKALPADLGPMESIDWVPIDQLARSLVELAVSSSTWRGQLQDSWESKQKTPNGTGSGTQQRADSGNHQYDNFCRVYHLVNPKRCGYGDLLPVIRDSFRSSLKMLSFEDWVRELELVEDQDLNTKPALKLLDFYKYLVSKKRQGSPTVTLSTERTVDASDSLAKMEAIKPLWMDRWMKSWGIPNLQ